MRFSIYVQDRILAHVYACGTKCARVRICARAFVKMYVNKAMFVHVYLCAFVHLIY